ncbi:MAG: maleylacetoacetate isomerase [Alphaproteobacteria bacterium]|nr:maleylacetoacetate isomerase [Alphaproteobacteria bacterium]
MTVQLYSYFRSSASYRVRIALHLKKIPFQTVSVDLRKNEQGSANYTSVNPQGLVPTLVDGDMTLSQSLVILEYLETRYPTVPLLPIDGKLMWKVKELTQFIACDIHPINNLRVLKYLTETLEATSNAKDAWYHHWIKEGFDILEKELARFRTPFALSDTPSWVDLCLIPQMYNAHRFKIDLSKHPRLCAIEAHCLTLDAFQKALPEHQDDCDL